MCFGFSYVRTNVNKRGGCGTDKGANVMDGTNPPRKTDEGEGGINV
jgi:hypothetical protein